MILLSNKMSIAGSLVIAVAYLGQASFGNTRKLQLQASPKVFKKTTTVFRQAS